MDQEIFGITVLEWLKVLVVPITVSAAVPWLNWLQKKREQTVEHQRAQDEALQAYLDKMSELLSPERVTARAQTLTVCEARPVRGGAKEGRSARGVVA